MKLCLPVHDICDHGVVTGIYCVVFKLLWSGECLSVHARWHAPMRRDACTYILFLMNTYKALWCRASESVYIWNSMHTWHFLELFWGIRLSIFCNHIVLHCCVSQFLLPHSLDVTANSTQNLWYSPRTVAFCVIVATRLTLLASLKNENHPSADLNLSTHGQY